MWRLRQEWRALPPSSRKVWWTTLAWGAGALALLSAALAALVRWLDGTGALSWERGLIQWMMTEGPIPRAFAQASQWAGHALVVFPLMFIASAVSAWRGRPLYAAALFLGQLLSEVAVLSGWDFWPRERPALSLEKGNMLGEMFQSFPSGHVVHAVFAFGLLAYLWFRSTRSTAQRVAAAGLWIVVSLSVAFGRLRLGAHWPSDVLGGMILGITWLSVVVLALHRAGAGPR